MATEQSQNLYKYPNNSQESDYARRREQTRMIASINSDLYSQTKKMQYLSNDLKEINQKVTNSRLLKNQLQKVENENYVLRQELQILKKNFSEKNMENMDLEKICKEQKISIEKLEFLLRSEKGLGRESTETIKNLTSKIIGMNEQNEDMENQLKNLLKKNILFEEENKSLAYDLQRMKNLNIDLQGQNEKLLKIKINAENESKEFYSEYLEFKGLYENEKVKNLMNLENLEKNVNLLRTVNSDYERCILKLVDLEGKCDELVKVNNGLRDELMYRGIS